MTDHISKAHNIYATASFLASPKLTLTGTVNLTMSESELEQVHMSEEPAEAATLLPNHNLEFEGVGEYSHLDYGYLQLGCGMKYQVSPRVALTADVEYADLEDETGYVYGFESGSYFMVRSGVRIDF